MKKIIALFIFGSSAASTSLFAQQTQQAPDSALLALAKESQNPVANMNTIPVLFNWFTGGGLGKQTYSQTLIQPVLPLPISKNWNVISRTIVPVLSIPAGGSDRLKGIGDIQEQLFFSQTHAKKVIWGVGPIFSFPTATIDAIATGQFAVGPAVVVLTMPGKWVLGAVANNLWKFAGSDSTTAINAFFVQPFINYNLKLGWAIAFAPAITANWAAPSGEQWTVPLGLGISKVSMISKQHVSLSLQYYHNVVRPTNAGADQVRMVVSLLFPK
jgi:hypothetical protein